MNVEEFKELLKDLHNEHLNAIMIHPSIMKEYWQMAKWEWFVEGFYNIKYALDCYNEGNKYADEDFWEALSWGWMCEYIYPYDDPYNPFLSPERKLRLGKW